MDRQMDGGIDRKKDLQMDRQMGGKTDRRMDRRME
jgi:hypothetical protein